MINIHIPTTDEGRAVPIAAFELALTRFAVSSPSVTPTDRQQDAMVEAIIDSLSGGTTHVGLLADHALCRAAKLEPEADTYPSTLPFKKNWELIQVSEHFATSA